ncbi:MAG: hypothetical protein DRH90_22305 [Deltaproteobacteria bacterium]|nr:MAG: hypothetical protein DRH90_22305 [Deltaproteobacteria bacterium]
MMRIQSDLPPFFKVIKHCLFQIPIFGFRCKTYNQGITSAPAGQNLDASSGYGHPFQALGTWALAVKTTAGF